MELYWYQFRVKAVSITCCFGMTIKPRTTNLGLSNLKKSVPAQIPAQLPFVILYNSFNRCNIGINYIINYQILVINPPFKANT